MKIWERDINIYLTWQHNWRGNAPQPVDYDRSMVVDWAKYEC